MSFISTYRDTSYVPSNLITVNGKTIECLAGYEVEWYDLSKDAGRNAKGTMRLAYIAQKYKIIFNTRPIHQKELQKIYESIPMEELTVKFFNPFTGQDKTIKAYRGDRKATMKWDRQYLGKLYEPVSQSLIEL